MIKASELRIGNWVNLRGDNMQVDGGDIYDLQDSENLDDWNPVPITPEILEQCGFERNGERYKIFCTENHWLELHLKTGLASFCFGFSKNKKDDSVLIGNRFEFIHQLQNLYFALTGEELQVNIHDSHSAKIPE